MQTINNYNFKGKKALIRVDFNVPLNENFEITDDTRMTAAVSTIKKVIEAGGSPVIMSHFGRPKSGPEDKYSMKHLHKTCRPAGLRGKTGSGLYWRRSESHGCRPETG
jgi:phosphoglycerate kinase